MRHFSIFAFLAIACSSVLGQEQQFTKCVNASGKEYSSARDAILKNGVARKFLEQKLQHSEILQRLQAEILLGWLDHEIYYRDLLKGPVIRDVSGNPHYYWTRRKSVKQEAVPLLLEIILKGGSHLNARSDAATALVLASARGIDFDPLSFLSVIGESRIKNSETRRSAAFVVGHFRPTKTNLKPDSILQLLKSEIDTTVAKSLVLGLTNTAIGFADRQKDDFVKGINEDVALKSLVGERDLIRAFGRLGGSEASRIVYDYARRSQNRREESFAIQSLSRMKNTEAMDYVIDYASKAETVKQINNASRALKTATKNRNRSKTDRNKALDALEELHRKSLDRNVNAKEIEEMIREMRSNGLGDDDLDARLNEVVDEIGRRIKK